MRIRGDYPERLRAILEHAARFAEVLTRVEETEPQAVWVRGRTGELRSVMLGALRAWREGSIGDVAAGDAILQLLDDMHRMVVTHCGGSTSLGCCRSDDAITFQGEDPTWPARPAERECQTEDTTLEAAWRDGPEILARVREGMKIIEAHARSLEKRIGNFCPGEDLRAFGREGLLDAARSFNEERGVPFSGWAGLRIRFAMIDGVRKWGGVPRKALQELRGLEDELRQSVGKLPASMRESWASTPMSVTPSSVDRTLHTEEPNPEEQLASEQLKSAVTRAVGQLGASEQELLREYYYEERTLEEAAHSVGRSTSWASRLHARVLDTLRGNVIE